MRELRLSVGMLGSDRLFAEASLTRDGPGGASRQLLARRTLPLPRPSGAADDVWGLARSWAAGRRDPHPLDPRGMPFEAQRGVRNAHWGQPLAQLLLEALLEPFDFSDLADAEVTRKDPLRVVVAPMDAAAAALPFETMTWPYWDETRLLATATGVSLVREAPVGSRMHDLPVTSVAARARGRFRVLVLATGAAEVRDEALDALRSVGPGPGAGTVAPPRQAPELVVPAGRFDGDGDALRRELERQRPDVLVCWGHGSAPEEQRASSWQVQRGAIPGDALAAAVGDLGLIGVVLAMCHSADSGLPDHSRHHSLAEWVQGAGVPFVVGFRGTPDSSGMAEFLTSFTGSLLASGAEALRGGREEPGLAPLERAVGAGRRAVQNLAPLVTVSLAPGVLAGRAPLLPPRRHGVDGRASAVVWHTPGQVYSATNTEGTSFRIPVVADLGQRVAVEVSGPRVQVSGAAVLEPSDVQPLVSAWPALRSAVVALTPAPPARGAAATWAPRTAELSAVARCLAAILGGAAPEAARLVLRQSAAADWGAIDAAPRALDARSGACLRLFDRWPPLAIRSPRGAVAAPSGTAWAAENGGRGWELVERLFSEAEADDLEELASRSHTLHAGRADLDDSVKRCLYEEFRTAVPVVGPGVAGLVAQPGREALRLPTSVRWSAVDEQGTLAAADVLPL